MKQWRMEINTGKGCSHGTRTIGGDNQAGVLCLR